MNRYNAPSARGAHRALLGLALVVGLARAADATPAPEATPAAAAPTPVATAQAPVAVASAPVSAPTARTSSTLVAPDYSRALSPQQMTDAWNREMRRLGLYVPIEIGW